jgi:uncharacterized membrane protein YeaQ/YmgE (transglycosylase-associated protein family)
MGSIISWLVAGVVVGILGKLVLPGKQNIPAWLTVVLGIVGAGVGTLIVQGSRFEDTSGIDWVKHILQVVIAAALIWIVTAVMNRNKKPASNT